MEKEGVLSGQKKNLETFNQISAGSQINRNKEVNEIKPEISNNGFDKMIRKTNNTSDNSVDTEHLNNSKNHKENDNNFIVNKSDNDNKYPITVQRMIKQPYSNQPSQMEPYYPIQQPYLYQQHPIQQPYLYQQYPIQQPYLYQQYPIQQPYSYVYDNSYFYNQNYNNTADFIHKSASAQNDYLKNIETDVRDIFKKHETLLTLGVDNIISNYHQAKDNDSKKVADKTDNQLKNLDQKLKELSHTLKEPLLEVNFNSTILIETIFKLVSNDLKTSRGAYFYLISILKSFNDLLKEQMNETIDKIDQETNKPKKKLSNDAINEIKKVSSCIDNILDECEFIDINDIKEELKARIKYINDAMSLSIINAIKYKIMDFFLGENYHKSAVLCKKYLKDIFLELDNFNNVQKKDDKQQSLEKIIESYGKYTKELSGMSTWLLYPDGKYSIGGKNDKLSNFINKIKKEKGFDTTNIFVGLFKVLGANNFVDAISHMKNEQVNNFIEILCKHISVNDLADNEKKKLFKLALKEENDKEKNEKIAKQFGIKIDEKDEKKDYKKDSKYKIIEECCEGVIGKVSANGTKKKFNKKQSYEEAMNEKELLIINNDAFDDKVKRVSSCIDGVAETINKNIDACNNYMTNLMAKEVDCGAAAYYNEMQDRLVNAINYYYGKLIEIVNSEFSDDPEAKKNMERAKLKIEEEIKVYSEEKAGIVAPKSGDEKDFANLIKGLDFRDISQETIDKRKELLKKINNVYKSLITRIKSIKPPVEEKHKINLYNEIKNMSEQNRSIYENIKTRDVYNKGLETLNQKILQTIEASNPRSRRK